MKLRRQEELIPKLCRESGRWLVSGRDGGDCYQVRTAGSDTIRYIDVRHQDDVRSVKFSATFPVRFPLENTPSGLFARLLLRSVSLHHSHWLIEIWESCEALPYLVARQPAAVMTPALFNAICREMVDELLGFQQELRDKFQGDFVRRHGGMGSAAPSGPEVRLAEPVALPTAAEAMQQIRSLMSRPEHRLIDRRDQP